MQETPETRTVPAADDFQPIAVPGVTNWSPANLPPLAPGKEFARSFTYAGQLVFPNVYLAPMSGVTDPSFRRLCKRLAGGRLGMLVSEFVSIEGLTRLNPRTCDQTRFYPEELPYTVQIFGSQIDRMGWAAEMVAESGATAVEINCGCPAPKVVTKGGGSGLLKQLPLLAKLCEEINKRVSIPTSIKVRLGWNEDLITVYETLKIAENSGMGLLVVHGRTRSQGYKGWANWDMIGEVKSRAKIPVVGNGDIATWQGVVDRLQRYDLDGVLVGRGAMHNPWIFRQVADFYEGREPQAPTLAEQKSAFHVYLELLREEMEHEGRILGKLKQFAARYMKALRGVAHARVALLRSQSIAEFMDIVEAFFASLEREGDPGWSPEQLQNLNGKNDDEVEEGTHWK